MTTPEQLAENTAAYLLPHPRYPRIVTEDYTYVAGPHDAWVLNVRTPNIEWARAETRRRGLPVVEWWVGWSSSPELADELLAHGLVPGDEPVLTGMTSSAAPPPAPHVEIRLVETAEQYLEALAVDWEVWQVPEDKRAERRASAAEDFREDRTAGMAHLWVALDDGRPVGFGRGIDLEQGVALMGGAVLPEARRRARHAAARRAGRPDVRARPRRARLPAPR
jgi:hypothetical protein